MFNQFKGHLHHLRHGSCSGHETHRGWSSLAQAKLSVMFYRAPQTLFETTQAKPNIHTELQMEGQIQTLAAKTIINLFKSIQVVARDKWRRQGLNNQPYSTT